ncbi:MAG: ferrochelatase [Deltaproteobacteria bacterium]|nr:ferrochelatase [Deltaproteobacteria bacterium]
MEKKAVLLVNLGGPQSLTEVKPFLENLFLDPDILPFKSNPWVRKLFAKTIALLRASTSKKYYQAMGGGSPLRKITELQAETLQFQLQKVDPSFSVYVGMRYWKPSLEEAWCHILRDETQSVVILPLYPQYSFATTRSAYAILDPLIQKSPQIAVQKIDSWYEESLYIDAWVEQIRAEIERLPKRFQNNYDLIFSAHSLPVKCIEEGDPYARQIAETIALVLKYLPAGARWHLSYQSQTRFMKWLMPSTLSVMASMTQRSSRAVLVIPISFVSDHVETLYEVDVFYQAKAQELNFGYFKRIPSLNASPLFIGALQAVVLRKRQEVQR